MAVFLVGAAATAAVVAGTIGLSRMDKSSPRALSPTHCQKKKTNYIYESAEQHRHQDPYDLKHSTYEANIASPGWDDQTWSWDCKQSGTCDGVKGNAEPGHAPLYGEHLPRPVGIEGDALSDYLNSTGRDRSTELEMPPERTKTYTSHPLDYGGQLMPNEIPHGAREATDLQFWGPTDWDAERNSRMPAYMDNMAMQFNGKEINRPLNDFGWQQFAGDDGFDEMGAEDVDYASGQASARNANVRLMQRNHYGSFVTSRDPNRPKFLPPIPTHAAGGQQPGLEPEITFGARLNKVFSGFLGNRNFGNQAPSDCAEVTFDQSKRLDYEPRLGNGRPRGGAQPNGPQINPQQGGRMRRVDDSLSLPMGQAKPRIAAGSSLDLNPKDGRHYSREIELSWDNNTVGKSRAGKNAYLLLGQPDLEYRMRKTPEDLVDYQSARGAARGSIYGGEATHGINLSRVKSCGMTNKVLGKGGRNILGRIGVITLGSNMTNGLKGGDVDNTPDVYEAGLINLRTPQATAIIGGRCKEALDDLFDVEHS